MTAPLLRPSPTGTSLTRLLSAAVSAYLGRYRDESRVHTESDLKVFLGWRAGQSLYREGLDEAVDHRHDRDQRDRHLQRHQQRSGTRCELAAHPAPDQ
jgi:hypothetical protein